jgi:ABC-type uncharacterized transport system ATPase subunit
MADQLYLTADDICELGENRRELTLQSHAAMTQINFLCSHLWALVNGALSGEYIEEEVTEGRNKLLIEVDKVLTALHNAYSIRYAQTL